MNKTSWFPVWLPYPKSWMMAIRLAIPAYFGATVVLAFEFWRYSFIGSILAATTSSKGLIFFFVVSSGALLLALIWFLILAGVYSLLLKLLWSNPPKWLTLPKIKSLIIRDFGILVLSVLPIVTIFIIPIYLLSLSSLKQRFSDARTLKLTYDVFLLRFWWIWLISAACLYQLSMRKSFQQDRS